MCSIPVVLGSGRSGRVSCTKDWLCERQAPTSNAPEASPAFFSNSRRLIFMTRLPWRKQILEILNAFTSARRLEDRKSTRLNSSHGYISYAVFCLKKKKYNADSHIICRESQY